MGGQVRAAVAATTMTCAGVLGALVLLSVATNSPLNPLSARPAHAAAVPVPGGLPAHFGLGLAAHPDSTGLYGWMPTSGIPWDYAYQYLSGGVNTGSGWETWNASGQFALYYAQGAAAHHYIPVFSYYELLQSTGSCTGCGEAQQDLSNLNNAGTMARYFQNFALLMQRLGSGTYNGIAGFGQTAIVHVEPDLSGYAMQAVLNTGSCYGYCTGQGTNPAYLRAAVASSGDPDVAGYPNTYQGFNWALLHLRDRYAPNVLLAFHVSDWATGTDVGSDASSTLNATALGQQAGSFAAQSGISGVPTGTSSYDLLFNDVLDRDAAYYKYVYGDAARWWDRLNVTFPNFHRWESYIGAASQVAGRPVLVWQIPEGNQYFDSENNTAGHYQDNRAEYFFGHIAELAQAGIIGLLFGAGNGGSTVHTDGMADGVTNPAGFCTTDGLSSGQVCNTHTSSVSDDDGGYIRLAGQQYYAGGGYPLGGSATATPTPARTATPSATATNLPTGTPTGTPTPAARLVISPPAVVPFQTVALTGTSFGPSEPVTVFWDRTTTPLTTTVSTALGGFVTRIMAPQAIRGTHTLIAFGQASRRAATAPVRIFALALVAHPSAAAGMRNVLDGFGFGPRETVRAYWEPGSVPLGPTRGVSTTVLGSFAGPTAITFTVPMSPAGTYYIVAVGQSSHAVAVATVHLTAMMGLRSTGGAPGSAAAVTLGGPGYGVHEVESLLRDCSGTLCSNAPRLGKHT